MTASTCTSALMRRLLEFPYLPSPVSVVDAALNMIKVKPNEIFADLGCGDGTVLKVAAEKFKAFCVGFEINSALAKIAHKNAEEAGLKHLIEVVNADFFTANLSKFNAIYVYPSPLIIQKLSEKLTGECTKGTKIIVHDYPLTKLNPARQTKIYGGEHHTHTIYLYII